MKKTILAFVTVLLLTAGCTDSPTSPARAGEISGTIRPGSGKAAFILEVTPASALDSLLVGPRPGDPGELVVHGPAEGRYLVLSDTTLAPLVRFRAFVNPAIDPGAVRLAVIETATLGGDVDQGEGASVSFAR